MSTTTTSTAPSKAPSKPKEYTLNSTHRCDRDGAQAYVRVVLESGLDLLFCRHHWLEKKPLMEAQKIIDSIVDESDRLVYDRHKGSENS
jgi:hypothetical protein